MVRVARLAVVLVAFLAACSDPPPVEIAGSYEGTAHRQGVAFRMNTDADEAGIADGTTSRFDGNSDGVILTWRRIDSAHVELELDGCHILFEQNRPPLVDDGIAHVVYQPPQTCRITDGDFDNDAVIDGTAHFSNDGRRVDLSLSSRTEIGDQFRAGAQQLEWLYEFDGERSRP